MRAVAPLVHQARLPVKLLMVGGETVEPGPDATPEIGMLQVLVHERGIADRVHFTGRRQAACSAPTTAPETWS